MVELGETLEFRVKPGQRFLNLSVWLAGMRGDDLESTSSSGPGPDAAVAAAPAPAKAPKFSFSRLFRLVREYRDKEIAEELDKSEADENWMKESRIGYVNLSLADIVADCQLNTQGRHISTYQLYPADFAASLGYVVIDFSLGVRN